MLYEVITVEKDIEILADQVTTYDVQLSQDLIGLDEVVVTGVVNPKSLLESSVAITSIKPKTLGQLGATTTAEVFVITSYSIHYTKLYDK